MMNDDIESKKKKFTSDLMAALACVGCIKDHLAAAGKDSNGDMVYQIRGDLIALPGRMLDDIEGVLNDALQYLYVDTEGDPIVERLKCVNELRGNLNDLKSVSADCIEFYDKKVPISQIAEIADKFTRNEIMSSNEIRAMIGLKPSTDPNADKLINSNLNHNR